MRSIENAFNPGVPAVALHNVTASYSGTVALRNVSFEVPRGELVAITGPSGSGKSTALRAIENIFPNPDPKKGQVLEGNIMIGGLKIASLKANQKDRLYRDHVGIGYQKIVLDDSRNICANVVRSLQSREQPVDKEFISYLAYVFGMADHVRKPAGELSGGQRSRAAMLEVLANRPKIACLDEPTGTLNTEGKIQVLEALQTVARDEDMAILMVTHDDIAHRYVDREIAFHDGVLISNTSFKPNIAA